MYQSNATNDVYRLNGNGNDVHRSNGFGNGNGKTHQFKGHDPDIYPLDGDGNPIPIVVKLCTTHHPSSDQLRHEVMSEYTALNLLAGTGIAPDFYGMYGSLQEGTAEMPGGEEEEVWAVVMRDAGGCLTERKGSFAESER